MESNRFENLNYEGNLENQELIEIEENELALESIEDNL